MKRPTKQWLGRGVAIVAMAVVLGCPGDNGSQPGTLSLAINPTSASVEQGSSTLITATATSGGGFSGAVGFEVTGAPSGVAAVVNSVVATGATTTGIVELQVAVSTAPGTYNITVHAQGTGVADGTAAFSLTVTALPDYALSLAPAALTIVQGGNGNSTVTIARTNFTGAVTLSLGGAPTGVTGAFAPAAPTGTSSALTVSVGAAVAPGTYNLTVNGTGAPGNRSAALSLTVAPTPNYALSVLPTSLTIVQGGSDVSTVTITRTNFTGAVTLSLGGAPAGVTGTFAPAAPTGTTSMLTLSVEAAVAPGTYNLTVDGTGTPGNRSTGLSLTVTAAPPDYALSVLPNALTIVQGGNDVSTVTITRTNFTGAVTLSLGGAPTGVTGAFAPATPTGTSSTLTVSVGAAVAPGTYNLTVDGSGTPGNRSTVLTLTVMATPDYALSVSPTTLTIVQGGNDVSTVTITRTNFSGAVTLSLGGAPAGVTGAFAPAAPTATTSTLTLSVGAAVPPGTYNLTVDGTGTPGNRSTALTLTVMAAPDYALSVAPATLTIVQGGADVSTVTITRTNFTGAVTLSLGGAPVGVTGTFAPAAPTGTSSTLTVFVGAAVAPGTYNLTVDGTGTPGNRSTALTLTVTAAPDYALSVSPAALTIVQGRNDVTTVTITRTNFPDAVTLSLGGAPAGVTGTFNPAAPTGTTSTLTIDVAATVTPGTYNLTVDGTGTPGNRSTGLTLTVEAVPTVSFTAAAQTVSEGVGTATITAQLSSVSSQTVTVPFTVGGTAANPADFTITASPLTITAGNTSATITVTVVADAVAEPDETVIVTLGAPSNATLGTTTVHTLTIGAQLPSVSFTQAAQSVNEGVGTTTITAQLSSASTQTVTVPFTLGGTAVDPADYTITASPLTIAAGNTIATITVTVVADAVAEPDETVIVTMGTPTNATLGPTTVHSVRIFGQTPTVSFTASAQTVSEGVGTATITAQLSSASTQTVTVPFTVGGTAANPADFTITASPLTITAGNTSATITVTVVADGVAEGDETVIVTLGTPTNATLGATTVHTLTITGGGAGGNVTVDFSQCPVADRAVWLAYQDGAGAWTTVTGVADVYTFGIASGTGGIAFVVLGAGNASTVSVQYMTQSQMTAGTLAFCGAPAPVGRTISGTAANVALTELAMLSLGGATTQVNGFASLNFQITDVRDGTHDLVGFRSDLVTPGSERGLLRRDIVVNADASIGTVDFAGSESFAAATATITVGGLGGGETVLQSMSYLVGATCQAGPLVSTNTGGATFGTFGIPSAQQRVSDYHLASIIAAVGTAETRTVFESFHTLANRTINLGSSLPAPAIGTLGGPYKRLQASFMLPGDYSTGSSFTYVDAAGDKRVGLNATFGYFGGGTVVLGLPDFSGLTGWDNNWAPASASTGDWVTLGSGNSPGSVCNEGHRSASATRGGSF
jgi:trimeric autotransporter adhesin